MKSASVAISMALALAWLGLAWHVLCLQCDVVCCAPEMDRIDYNRPDSNQMLICITKSGIQLHKRSNIQLISSTFITITDRRKSEWNWIFGYNPSLIMNRFVFVDISFILSFFSVSFITFGDWLRKNWFSGSQSQTEWELGQALNWHWVEYDWTRSAGNERSVGV